jgi:hypothetical protein
MNVSRIVIRGARGLRTAPLQANIGQARFESLSTTSQAAKTGGSSGLVGGYCVLGVSCLLIGEAIEVGDIHSSVRLRACHNRGIVGGAIVFAVSDSHYDWLRA